MALSGPSANIPSPKDIASSLSVSLNTLIGLLDTCEIVHSPKDGSYSVNWIEPICETQPADQSQLESKTLYLCDANLASAAISCEQPASQPAMAVVISDETLPAWATSSELPSRMIIIRDPAGPLHCFQELQRIFISVNVWKIEMDRIAFVDGRKGARGALPKLLSYSAALMGGFVCVTGTGFDLIACSDTPPSLDSTYSRLIANGCYDSNEIAWINEKVLTVAKPKKSIIICEPHEGESSYTLHAPLYIDESYLFHFTFVCPETRPIATSIDLFEEFIARATLICTDFWKNNAEIESAYHKTLINMIENKKMSREFIDTQLQATMIPSANLFRLVRYHLPQDIAFSKRSAILKTASSLNEGHCYPFVYRGDLVVLCYATASTELSISLNRIIRSSTKNMYEPFGLVGVISQHFTNIKNISYAFRQTEEAEKYKDALSSMYPQGYDGAGGFPVITFEHALEFMVLDDSVESDLVSYSLGNGILKTLVKEDACTGATFVTLLWKYICLGLNATSVAKQMNIHRNTVVYHINKFEKRFDLSLESPMTRHRLFLDFVYYFKHSC